MKQGAVLDEREAIGLLLNYYLTMGARWYGSLTMVALGVITPPLAIMASGASHTSTRIVAATLTTVFLWATAYAGLKVQYGNRMISELLRRSSVQTSEAAAAKELKTYILALKDDALGASGPERRIVRNIGSRKAAAWFDRALFFGLGVFGSVLLFVIFAQADIKVAIVAIPVSIIMLFLGLWAVPRVVPHQ